MLFSCIDKTTKQQEKWQKSRILNEIKKRNEKKNSNWVNNLMSLNINFTCFYFFSLNWNGFQKSSCLCAVFDCKVCDYTNNNNFSFCLMKKKREEINCEIAKIAGVCQHSHDEWRFCSLKRLIKFNYFGRIFLKRKRWSDDVDEVSQSKDMEQAKTKTEIHPVSRLNQWKWIAEVNMKCWMWQHTQPTQQRAHKTK